MSFRPCVHGDAWELGSYLQQDEVQRVTLEPAQPRVLLTSATGDTTTNPGAGCWNPRGWTQWGLLAVPSFAEISLTIKTVHISGPRLADVINVREVIKSSAPPLVSMFLFVVTTVKLYCLSRFQGHEAVFSL